MQLAPASQQVRCDVGASRRNVCAVARLGAAVPAPTASSNPFSISQCSTALIKPSQRAGIITRSADATAAVTTVAAAAPASTSTQQLTELNKDTFQSFLDAAGDKLVVVDFFTDWCGPCKLIYPQLVALSAELEPAATIVKFNCNQHNKELAKALGIKVAPTFHLYKNGQKVADMTGAKVDKLRALIDDHLRPQQAADEQN